ncbi:MAG: protein kinase [Phycisphaerales bacterium JB039]
MHDATRNAKQVFAEALELPADQREAFVRRSAGADDAVAQRALELLRAHTDAGAFLETPTHPPAGAGASSPAAPGGELPAEAPDRVGHYRLLRRLGEGHYGEVFEAEQTEPVRRRVAIKILKRGVDSRQTLARFQAERQAVASLDHPNLSRFLDAGETPDGRPYFVMDLVRGTRITEYCDTNHFTIRERVRLMIDTCRAVQHAHDAGLVHRDLKPGNIMVEVRDDRATPRVIDFGIVRAIAGPAAAPGTLHGQVLGTPGYMSPEQASGLPEIDSRADVYALGCVLYELLAGSTPIPREELVRLPLEDMQRAVREREIPAPSERLGAADDALRAIARRRGVESARLPSIVQGELDWICAKALARDRAERYENAGAMADDLQRWSDGRPVAAARARARRGRVTRFVRRNRRTLRRSAAPAALVLVLFALLAGWIPGVLGAGGYIERIIERYVSGARTGLPEGAWVNGVRVNRAGGQYALVGGGRDNRAASDYASVGGGFYNIASAPYSMVGGGRYNVAEGEGATVAGGVANIIRGHKTTVGGGDGNEALGVTSTIAGGANNRTRSSDAVVSGGRDNAAFDSSTTVGGGRGNRAGLDDADGSNADGSTIAGGINNVALWRQSTVAGGFQNQAVSSHATVAGGSSNTAGTADRNLGAASTVAGGESNRASGTHAAIPGGRANQASGAASFAAGSRAQALHDGAFVWSDLTRDAEPPAASAGPNSFTARARGGFALLSSLEDGARLKAGEGGWSSLLSAASRTETQPADPGAILAQVARLNLHTFRYAAQPTPERHLAPTAEQFHELLGLGAPDGQVLATDLDGVALAAIQALLARVDAQDALLAEQASRIAALEQRLPRP